MTLFDLLGTLTAIERREYYKQYPDAQNAPPTWYAKERNKYTAIDCGGSGAFLLEKETGELFNIKGYGVPDHNKKRKANLGNIATVDAETLWRKRWNYLR
jgi:hypothetical protein